MAKIIKLTESDLRRIVKKVIKEQKSFVSEGDGSRTSPFLDQEIQPDVDIIVDDLDGWVDGSNLESIFNIVMKYNNKFASDYTNPNNPVMVPALKRLIDLYSMDENGDNLIDDLQEVGTTTLPNASITKKQQVINLLKPFAVPLYKSPQTVSTGTQSPTKPTPKPGPGVPTKPQTSGGAQSSGPRNQQTNAPRPTTAQSPTSRMPVR